MPENYDNLPPGVYAQIETPQGVILAELEYQKAPMTVSNFVGLAEGTIANTRGAGRFFDGLTFHRVERGFVIQGGDPQGNGSGGPGYAFPNEIDPSLGHTEPGVLAMANAGPGTNGSQFYITMAPAPWLDGQYSIFGRVIQGQERVQAIRPGDRIEKILIIRVGEEAEAFKPDNQSFQTLVREAVQKEEDRRNEESKQILEEIARRWPDLEKTPTGLMFKILRPGQGGASPRMDQRVTVDYVGTFLDGSQFDSSYDEGKPAVFQVGQVIEGWNEALLTMKKGEKRLLVIPPHLGYGERGYPGAIPGNAFLVFEVDLLDF